jgi:hypothetical protein
MTTGRKTVPSNKSIIPTRCRHERNCWIIFGGLAIWCYVCGAWRRLTPTMNFSQELGKPIGPWFKPSGDRRVNPAMKEAVSDALR